MLCKQKLLACALMFVAVCGVCVLAQTPATNSASTPAVNSDDSTTGGLTGSVVNESGQPMAGVQVFVRGINARTPPRTSTTDTEGNFKLNGLSPALYIVTANVPAYVTTDGDPNLSSHYYRLGDAVRIQLIRGGVITGTVTNSAGEPVIGVAVRATMLRDAQGQAAGTMSAYFTDRQTDDRGVYRIFGLMPGTYVVSAGGMAVAQRFQLSPYESDVPTFAPSSAREGAAEVSVRAGDEANVDIRYRGETGHSITGSIKASPSGSSATVSLSFMTGGYMPISSAFQLPGSHSFNFPGLADGEYVLVAQQVGSLASVPASQIPDILISEPRRVTVKGADVAGIELVPQPLSSINGRIALQPSKIPECQGKRRPLFSEMVVKAEPPAKDREQDPIPFLRSISGSASPDAKGSFTMRNLFPSRYLPQLSFYARYWYLDSVSVAATPKFDAAANWMTLKSGERAELTITLTEGAASIRGKVESVASGVGVYLLPADREKVADVLRYFVTDVAADGTFLFNNLPPGRYLVALRTLNADTNTTAKLRLPDATEARTKLRRAAETQKINLELKPCQNLADYELKQSAP